ncbi:hypothetical protein PAJ34TS1_06050 [Paenibacillus azoreducens]|uniref:Uncharacterized protein n=1 Tax=Paenibacillus azoreducens TaxID=116718 RepID=A0A920CW80_9BACL|nr:hypothetical protein J34TS1_58680 [Paenibacillus azoreducens]
MIESLYGREGKLDGGETENGISGAANHLVERSFFRSFVRSYANSTILTDTTNAKPPKTAVWEF